MKKQILIAVLIIALVGCAALVYWYINSNKEIEEIPYIDPQTGDTLVVTWKGKNIELDNPHDVIAKVEEMLIDIPEEKVYMIHIITIEVNKYIKRGFFASVTYSDGNKMLIQALNSDETLDVQSIRIIGMANMPSYVIVDIDDDKIVLPLSRDELNELKALCGVK